MSRRPMVHGPWITGHDPTIQQPHGPIGHHSPTVLQHKGPSSILPHKLRHKPKPDSTHQPGFAWDKKSARRKKATCLGGFQVSMVSEAGFEPAHPKCGHKHLKLACLPFHHSDIGLLKCNVRYSSLSTAACEPLNFKGFRRSRQNAKPRERCR